MRVSGYSENIMQQLLQVVRICYTRLWWVTPVQHKIHHPIVSCRNSRKVVFQTFQGEFLMWISSIPLDIVFGMIVVFMRLFRILMVCCNFRFHFFCSSSSAAPVCSICFRVWMSLNSFFLCAVITIVQGVWLDRTFWSFAFQPRRSIVIDVVSLPFSVFALLILQLKTADLFHCSWMCRFGSLNSSKFWQKVSWLKHNQHFFDLAKN